MTNEGRVSSSVVVGHDLPSTGPIEAVSWDVDGTLYSMRRLRFMLALVAIQRILKSREDARRAYEELRTLQEVRRHLSSVRARGGILEDLGPLSSRAVIEGIEERWYGEAMKRIGARALAKDLIQRVRKAGLRQVVVSDYVSTYKLRALGLEQSFDNVYAGEEMGFVKPNSNLFRMVADSLGVDPSRLLHIGDLQKRDGVAATGAGCQVAIIGRDNEILRRFRAALPA